jgi:3-deoxy-manno-octulosonate cytidylyltransferase (CMP-KDO synthetase)
MNIVGIIPARWASTRLPGKPLADLGGRPLIERVWRRACQAKSLSRVIVATDDARIAAAVRRFGGEAVMTPADCASGTDRLAVVAKTLACQIVVNIQGDEPFILPATIDRLCAPLIADARLPMATLSAPLPPEEAHNPNAVKVVCDRAGQALYFSRAPIPHPRDGATPAWRRALRLHLGLYAYRRSFLLKFAAWPQTPLEKLEKLEQLRALEHGAKIAVVQVKQPTLSVDTQADLEQARKLLQR